MKINLDELADFIVRAKKETYAGNGNEVTSQRPGFKELEYIDGDWNYRDSYTGFYIAPGQEVVRHKDTPVWTMSYNGGMMEKYHGNVAFAKETFTFLKEALSLVKKENPFRGPPLHKKGDFGYITWVKGDITDFTGNEMISHKKDTVFMQRYNGGLVVHKVA